jgi:hypothetical protein
VPSNRKLGRQNGRVGSVLANDSSMRRRIWFTFIVVIVVAAFAVVPAASTLTVALAVVPLAIVEPGSLLLLGITFLTLAGVAQRFLS